jgi:hypothetical protein
MTGDMSDEGSEAHTSQPCFHRSLIIGHSRVGWDIKEPKASLQLRVSCVERVNRPAECGAAAVSAAMRSLQEMTCEAIRATRLCEWPEETDAAGRSSPNAYGQKRE